MKMKATVQDKAEVVEIRYAILTSNVRRLEGILTSKFPLLLTIYWAMVSVLESSIDRQCCGSLDRYICFRGIC